MCSAGGAAQNGIKVAPSHGSAFYVDTSASPKLDAGYVGYRVTNNTGSSQTTLWTEITDFSGTVLSLANPADTIFKLPTLANNATGTAYFLLKGTGATTNAQAHTIKVYDDRPDLAGATLLYECTFTFSQVKETIKAASNKVEDNTGDAVAISISDSSPELGQLITITVEGSTGNIGNGAAPDGSIVWLTPAAMSSWPTRALRLENVSIVFDTNNNWNSTGDQVTYTNQLLITNAKSALQNSAQYRATYTFRVVGRPQSSVTAVPVAQISSGTQTKHTDTGAAGATVNLSFASLEINAGLTKNVTATSGLEVATCTEVCDVPGGLDGTTYAAVPYRLRATSTTATTISIDEVVDTPATGVIYKPGSATVTDIGRTSVAISDPVYLSLESELSPRPYHFVGPFTLDSGTSATIDYTMWVPVGTYANTAYARLGDVLIGATGSAMSEVTVTSNGTSEIEAIVTTVPLSVTVLTEPATNITSTGATLNGTIDPNGTTPLTGMFEYGTSPTLVGAVSATATTPVNGTLDGLSDPTAVSLGLTGLSANTQYYYRVRAGEEVGDIHSFTTLAILAAPTVAAQAASGVGLTSATLNGTINPNLTPVTAVQFIYSTSPTFASGNVTTTLDDGNSATLTIGGSSLQTFSTGTGVLIAGTAYYFKIRACTASSGTYPSITCSSFVDSSTLSFVAAGAPTVTTVAASSVGATIATLSGTVNANHASATVSFVYGTSPTLASGNSTQSAGVVAGSASSSVDVDLTGLSSATTYYFRVEAYNNSGTTTGGILEFTTSAVNRTLTIDAESFEEEYVFTGTTPTLTATPSAGGGTITFSSDTPAVCTVNELSGEVTFVSAGTCTIGAVVSSFESYSDASSPTVSFEITASSRTLTIDAGSYENTYAFTDAEPTLTATPSTGAGIITFISNTLGVCTVGEQTGIVSFVALGTCEIESTISADGGDAAATSTPISFQITVGERTLAIDAESYTDLYLFTDESPTLTATPSAGGGTITFSSDTPAVCTVDSVSGEVEFLTSGTCLLSSAITAQGLYDSADSPQISIEISSSDRSLTIDSDSYDESYVFNDTPPTISATPSAGAGDIAYIAVSSGVCSVDDSTGEVSFVSVGTCQLRATITADGSYDAATSSSISFIITGISRTLTINADSYEASYSIGVTGPTLTSTVSAGGGAKTYSSLTPSTCTVNASSGLVTLVSAGTCTLSAAVAASGNYGTATASSISFTLVANAVQGSSSGGGRTTVRGCTDKTATNYSSRATRDDNSCTYARTTELKPVTPAQAQTDSETNTQNNERPHSAYVPEVCAPYLTTFIRLGRENDPTDVAKLQTFLNEYEGELLVVDGVYKEVDVAAVARFQAKHVNTLTFWNLLQPTGYVYITTQKEINKIYCEKTKQLTCPYFTEYLKEGDSSAEVGRVKAFLNNVEGSTFDVTSLLFDAPLTQAVRSFQQKYTSKVLEPWGLNAPTGLWYQSTKKTANDLLGCYAPVRLDNGTVLE